VQASNSPQTWHYGVVARFWAEFNNDGPEIPYYLRRIEAHGQPALDAGCGTGRLLLPALRAGLDVDGSDISTDMLELCRSKAEREGFAPRLYAQAMHELALPRTYRTIVACGAFGLGSDREGDRAALRRFYEHLEPGGVLLFDHEMPYADPQRWRYWLGESRQKLPEPWPTTVTRRVAADGSEYELFSIIESLDPLEQRVTLRMRAALWQNGTRGEEEECVLVLNLYFKGEILLMLEQAGFELLGVEGPFTDIPAKPDDGTVVFVARKPG
jgi:SAM-dependent methyltransferase